MRIDSLIGGQLKAQVVEQKPKAAETSFGDTIKDALSKVNEKQATADEFANKLASGEAVEIHQAMIAMSQASTALQFTVQVRNKVVEAYQEIMRMQV